MKELLVLGGTHFVGRRFVERMMSAPDIRITLCNRGKTHPELFPDLERIVFNREVDDPGLLGSRTWDYVVDFSGYYPLSLERLLLKLEGRVGRYVFISTLSVFSFDEAASGHIYTEQSETLPCSAEQMIDKTMMSYGARKAECERVLEQAHWLESVSLRPSIIYGKYEWTDRLYYWLYRCQKCSSILLPNQGLDLVTLTELEDLCRMIEGSMLSPNLKPAYNATTHTPMTFAEMLEYMYSQSPLRAVTVPIDLEQCNTYELQPGADFPLWFGIPMNISNAAICSDLQLECRDFVLGIQEAVQQYADLGWPLPKAGMSLEKEAKIITELRAR